MKSAARVATETVSTTSIVGVRLACQALVLMLSARLLGVDGFGVVAAIVAISLVLGPWGGLGYDFVALRSISHDRSRSASHFRFGTGLILKSAIPLIIVTSLIVALWAKESSVVLLTVLILSAELVFLRSVELIAKIFQGHDLFREMALTRLAISISRLLIFGGIAFATPSISTLQWGWANLAAAILSLAAAVLHMRRRLGPSSMGRDGEPAPLRDGLYFAAGITSMRLSTEFDKSLVLALVGAMGAGIYAAAQRIVALAVAPVITLVNVVITSLFRLKHRQDNARLRRQTLLVGAAALVYGVVVAVFLWNFLPDVAALALGEEFRALAVGLLPLSLLVIPTSCRMVGEQAVAALGKFRLRLVIQWLVAALSITLNLVWIPRLGWEGAAWALVTCETALALSFISIVVIYASDSPEAGDE